MQALRSLILIISLINLNSSLAERTFVLALFIKLGAWPFLSWYLRIIQQRNIKAIRLTIIITWQKILPSYLFSFTNSILISRTLITLIFVNLTAPLLLLKTNMSLKKTIAISSANNNRWILIISRCSLWGFLYFIRVYRYSLYSVFNNFYKIEKNSERIHEKRFWGFLIICNIGGLPPLPIFWGKVAAIKVILTSSTPTLILSVIILTSCFLLFFYLKTSIIRINIKKRIKQLKKWRNPSKLIFFISLACSFSLIIFFLKYTKDCA